MSEVVPERPVPGTGELAEMVYGPYNPERQNNHVASQQLADVHRFYQIALCESNHDQIVYWRTVIGNILEANPHLREDITPED